MRSTMNEKLGTTLLRRLSRRQRRLVEVIARLADGHDLPIYLVGGVVRDLFLKRTSWDLDLTVEGDGPALARLAASRLRAGLVVYERFATARLTLPDGTKIDIASTRGESYALPGALPDVQPASLAEDLRRRDFTINAMAIRLNAKHWGELYDPYGGRLDLRARILRVLHDGSFIDDPTRIFRAVRFTRRFGFRLERATARLLKEAAATDQIARLSGPRLCNELLLLLREADPRGAVDQLLRLRLLRFLHPRLRFGRTPSQVMKMIPGAIGWWTHVDATQPVDRGLVNLMALLHGAAPAVLDEVIGRLTLSSEQAEKVRWAGAPVQAVARRLISARSFPPSSLYRLLVALPNEARLLALAHALSGTNRAGLVRAKKRLAVFLSQLQRHRPFLRGRDLLGIGLTPGPQMGRILAQVVDAQLDGLVKNKPQALDIARRLSTARR